MWCGERRSQKKETPSVLSLTLSGQSGRETDTHGNGIMEN